MRTNQTNESNELIQPSRDITMCDNILYDNMGEVHVMADGCTALMRVLFGDINWERFNQLKFRSQLPNLQEFITWLLDVGEHDMNKYAEPGEAEDTSNNDEVILLPSDISDGVSNYLQSSSTAMTSSSLLSASLSVPGPSDLVAVDGAGVEIHFIIASNAFFCHACHVSLNDVEVVREHLNLRHNPDHLSLVCECCNQRFPSMEEYVDYHRKSMAALASSSTSSASKKKHVCEMCAKPFPSRIRLEDHVAIKHYKTGPRYHCPTCGKKFSYNSDFLMHKKKCALAATSLVASM